MSVIRLIEITLSVVRLPMISINVVNRMVSELRNVRTIILSYA